MGGGQDQSVRSRATLDRVVLKTGEIPVTTKLSNGTFVAAVFAGQVSHMELRQVTTELCHQPFLWHQKHIHLRPGSLSQSLYQSMIKSLKW